MKQLWCIILGCFLSLAIIPSVSADPTVIIENYTLSPEVFMPGDSGLLTLTIINAETTNTVQTTSTSGSDTTVRTDTVGATIDNIWIASATDGNNKVKATQNFEEVGDLAPGSSININFKMIAENNITEGLYFPIAHVDVEYNEDVQFPFPVKVSNATVDLLLTNIPSRISKSGSTYVTLTAVNSRENTVDSVIIIPESPDGLEFSPNSVFVGTLDADTSSEASFSIKPHNTGNHSLNFTVQFKNGDNIHTELVTYSIEVVETLDVAPVFVSVPSSIEFGKSTRVSLEVYNAKTESITGVIVTPITAAKVTPSQYFIGSMDPDDVFSATFDIFTDDLSYGDYILSFKVSFKQDNEYYETSTISSPFSVIPASQINRNGDVILPLGALGIIIVVIVFFLFYMKRRRPSK